MGGDGWKWVDITVECEEHTLRTNALLERCAVSWESIMMAIATFSG